MLAHLLTPRLVSVLLVPLTLLLVAETASAYVLPANFLVRMLAERRQNQKVRDLSIQLHTEIQGEEEPIEERLYLKTPERLRRVRQGEDGQVYVEREGKRALGSEGKLVRLKGKTSDLVAPLLAAKGKDVGEMGKRILGRMKSVGIDVEVVTMGRYEMRPVYIIGAHSWEGDKPQVWLDKSNFMPVRVILPGSGSQGEMDGLIDTQLRDYGSAVAGNWFPRVVDVYRNGALVSHAEVTSVQVNQQLPETLFDVP